MRVYVKFNNVSRSLEFPTAPAVGDRLYFYDDFDDKTYVVKVRERHMTQDSMTVECKLESAR